MCANWNTDWIRYDKHRKARIPDWDSGRAHCFSEHGASQYDPHRYSDDAAVEDLERRCVTNGIPIRSTVNKKTFYLKVEHVVGVCRGVKTDFVFAEWSMGGGIHGRPISREALRDMGVQL